LEISNFPCSTMWDIWKKALKVYLEESLHAKHQLNSSSRFGTIPACDGQTDKHTILFSTRLKTACQRQLRTHSPKLTTCAGGCCDRRQRCRCRSSPDEHTVTPWCCCLPQYFPFKPHTHTHSVISHMSFLSRVSKSNATIKNQDFFVT